MSTGTMNTPTGTGSRSSGFSRERFQLRNAWNGTNAAAYTATSQQGKFEDFRHEYNHERSHEALDRKCPDQVYQPSPRVYPEKISPILYDEGLQVRTVKRGGEIKWRNKHY